MHELAFYGGRWQDADLTAITGGPSATGGIVGIAVAFDQISGYTRTHYVAQDQHVHELAFHDSRWQDADLTAITGGPNADPLRITIAFDQAWNRPRTHYIDNDGHVHELSFY